jgi:hypothetical protein
MAIAWLAGAGVALWYCRLAARRLHAQSPGAPGGIAAQGAAAEATPRQTEQATVRFWTRPVRPAVAALVFLAAGLALVFEELPMISVGAIFFALLGAAVAYVPRPARDDPSRLRHAILAALLVAAAATAHAPLALWLERPGSFIVLALLGTVGFVLAGALAIADDLRSYRRSTRMGPKASG